MEELLQKYAIVFSELLEVDVSIIDTDFMRIAGTGMYAPKVGVNIESEGSILKRVIATGDKWIIENPRVHEICSQCVNKEKCKETFEMSTAIFWGDQVVGGIGFACFSEEQKKNLMRRYDTHNQFLDHISDLISSKVTIFMEGVQNRNVLNLINSIMDRIDEGVVIVDNNSLLEVFNARAKEVMSHCTDLKIGQPIEIVALDNEILEYDEYKIIYNGTSLNVAGKFLTIDSDFESDIFIFKSLNMLKEALSGGTQLHPKNNISGIIGDSVQMEVLKEKVKLIAPSASTVLITGESGTGKELFARAIHDQSTRSNAPFVAINCGAIPDNLLESELFGYVRGAFTGADPKGKLGKFELADGGTLFLDEIGDMPLYIQVKILRALEERVVIKLGSNTATKIDVRIIAATNKPLEEMILEGQFRADLYYRLNVIPMELPPLRVRIRDIDTLTMSFIKKFATLFDKNVKHIEDSYMRRIHQYPWPGNVRELQNVIEYSINMLQHPWTLTEAMLPRKIIHMNEHIEHQDFNIERMERKLIQEVHELYCKEKESKLIISEKLGIGIATLYRKLKKYDIG